MNKFWNWVKNEDTGQRTLYLEGVIAQESWFGDEVTPAAFKDELMAGNQPITVHINSIGGDCVAASQIYTMLMDYPAKVNVQIDGLAASAASVVAMAGRKVSMSPTALMMVHNPWTSASGDAADMQKAVALLDEVKESIINAYQIKTGMSREELSCLMDAEAWMNAKRAKELGFCDEVLYEDEAASEKMAFSYSGKAAELQLMNRIRASVVCDSPENAQPTEPTEAPVSEDSDIDTSENEEDAPSNDDPLPHDTDRVKVLDTDIRLEHLRY